MIFGNFLYTRTFSILSGSSCSDICDVIWPNLSLEVLNQQFLMCELLTSEGKLLATCNIHTILRFKSFYTFIPIEPHPSLDGLCFELVRGLYPEKRTKFNFSGNYVTSSTISSGELPDTLPCVWFSQLSFSKENGVQMLQNKPNLLEKTTNLIIWKLTSFLHPSPQKTLQLECLVVQRLDKAITIVNTCPPDSDLSGG